MKLSIIVPVYNAEKHIKGCIDSILNQTFADFELLLIDDGSVDNSGSICDEYSKIDKRIHVIHKKNQGVSSARNIGIDNAQGDFIGFIDADDNIEPNMFEKLYRATLDNNVDVVCCGYYREEQDKIYEKHRQDDSVIVFDSQVDIFREYLRQDYDSGFGDGNWNKIFSRNAIGDTRYKSYANGEDVDFQIEIFKKINKIACIPDLLYHYVCNDTSFTAKEFSEKNMGILHVADDLLEYINEKLPENRQYAYAFHLTWYMSVLQKIYESKKPRRHHEYIDVIRNKIKNNYSNYKDNKYAKRLDKYLARALYYKIVPLALVFRKLVIVFRKVIMAN